MKTCNSIQTPLLPKENILKVPPYLFLFLCLLPKRHIDSADLVDTHLLCTQIVEPNTDLQEISTLLLAAVGRSPKVSAGVQKILAAHAFPTPQSDGMKEAGGQMQATPQFHALSLEGAGLF
jgi:hypothetical protein